MNDLDFLHNSLHKESKNKTNNQIVLPIYIVEDDHFLARSLKRFFEKTFENIRVREFSSSNEFLEYLTEVDKEEKFCLLADISLGHGTDGLSLIEILNERKLNFISVVMTGFASIESAISATKQGVFHYLTKPFELETLKDIIQKACLTGLNIDILKGKELKRLTKKTYQKDSYEKYVFQGIIGKSNAMKKVFDRMKKLSSSNSTVLITGASGTGKELVARALHRISSRGGHKFVTVNCGAIPADLLEAELFGQVAVNSDSIKQDRIGRIESAQGGTLLLNEVFELSPALQLKLLSSMQDKIFSKLGSDEQKSLDTRIIASSHKNLEKLVQEGKFREDLFYKLNIVPIVLPELRERREDIPILIDYFLHKFTSVDGSNRVEISDAALNYMVAYDWPGNVRELENVIERLVVLRAGQVVIPEDLPAKIFNHNPLTSSQYKTIFKLPEEGIDLKTVLADIEDALIVQALGKTSGNRNQASKLLGLNRTTLIEKIKKRSLDGSHEVQT